MTKPQHFTVTNKLTGEVVEIELTNIEEAKEIYLALKSTLEIMERAKGRVGQYIANQVDDRIDFGDGYVGMWVRGTRKHYRLETLRKYLDEDQLALVTEVNPTKLKDLLAQLVEDGHGIPGAWDELEQTADQQPIKPYFAIRRGKQ